jgi:hypothetical protein
LIDARNDAHIWAHTYDRDLADVFAIQSEIAEEIAGQLQAKLSPNEKKAIEQPPTTDLAAFGLYSRAKTILLTRVQNVTNEGDMRQAVDLLDQAVRRDPSFFDAYCQLVVTHGYITPCSASIIRPAASPKPKRLFWRARAARCRQTHLARAQYLIPGCATTGALAELEVARRTLSNDARILNYRPFCAAAASGRKAAQSGARARA